VSRLNVAVVGAGFIASRKHLPALQGLKSKVHIAAICDQNLAQATGLARQYGNTHVYQDVSEMLAKEKLDIVNVCTPPATHADVSVKAIQAGCNVLIEKPMALHPSECDAIIQASKLRGVKVCVAHSDLFYPPFIKAKNMVAKGEIGQFTGMRIFLSTPTSYMTSREEHWAHRLPGGVIGETGPHLVYMTLAYINPITSVLAQGFKRLPDFPWSTFEDYRIELAGEKAASTVTSIYTSKQWAALVDLWGTEGGLTLDLESMTLVRHRRPSLNPLTIAKSQIQASLQSVGDTVLTGLNLAVGRYKKTHDVLIESFVNSILKKTDSPVPPEEGKEAVRVMNLIASQLEAQKAQPSSVVDG